MLDDEVSREFNASERLNHLDKMKTAVNKVKFINEIKSGLGQEIKEQPTFKIIREPWYSKLGRKIKKILTRL